LHIKFLAVIQNIKIQSTKLNHLEVHGNNNCIAKKYEEEDVVQVIPDDDGNVQSSPKEIKSKLLIQKR